MQYLLDTNVCIAAMQEHPLVVQHLSALTPDDCAISTITAYELFTGVEKCGDPEREWSKVEQLLNMVSQLPFDSAAAAEAARIRADLEAAGHSIGPYDNLLAGHALANGLIFVTNNTAEFERVAGLSLESRVVPGELAGNDSATKMSTAVDAPAVATASTQAGPEGR